MMGKNSILFFSATIIAVRYRQYGFLGDSNNDNFVGKLFGECSALLRHGAIFEIISTTLHADNMFHIMIREYFVDYEKSESSKMNESI